MRVRERILSGGGASTCPPFYYTEKKKKKKLAALARCSVIQFPPLPSLLPVFPSDACQPTQKALQPSQKGSFSELRGPKLYKRSALQKQPSS